MSKKSLITATWTVACRKSFIDRDSNNLLVGEIIEDFTFQVPESIYIQMMLDIEKKGNVILPAEFEVLSLLESEPGSECTLEVQIKLPSGVFVPAGIARITFGPNGRVRNRVKYTALPIGGTGKHVAVVSVLEGQTKTLLTETPFMVSIQKK